MEINTPLAILSFGFLVIAFIIQMYKISKQKQDGDTTKFRKKVEIAKSKIHNMFK